MKMVHPDLCLSIISPIKYQMKDSCLVEEEVTIFGVVIVVS